MNQLLQYLAIGLALAVLSSEVQADVSARIFINWNAQDGSVAIPTDYSQTLTQGTLKLTTDNFWQPPAKTTGGSAFAQVEYGALKASSFASALENNASFNPSGGYASSVATWKDLVVFSSPGVPLTASGFANALLYIDGGGLDFTGVALGPFGRFQLNAQANFTLAAASKSVFTLEMREYCDIACPQTSYTRINGIDVVDFRGLYEVRIPITFSPFGTELTASLSTQASRSATYSAFGTATADLANSVYWAGITSVVLPNGQVSTDFTALGSTSGHNYALSSAPVPEPRSSILLFLGLGYLTLKWRVLRPNPSLKLSTNGVSRWSPGAGPAAHFAPVAQRATPLAPA